jgi:hypothetical protein
MQISNGSHRVYQKGTILEERLTFSPSSFLSQIFSNNANALEMFPILVFWSNVVKWAFTSFRSRSMAASQPAMKIGKRREDSAGVLRTSWILARSWATRSWETREKALVGKEKGGAFRTGSFGGERRWKGGRSTEEEVDLLAMRADLTKVETSGKDKASEADKVIAVCWSRRIFRRSEVGVDGIQTSFETTGGWDKDVSFIPVKVDAEEGRRYEGKGGGKRTIPLQPILADSRYARLDRHRWHNERLRRKDDWSRRGSTQQEQDSR